MQTHGNEALKRGVQLRKKFFVLEAVACYTRGLEVQPRSPALLAVLHSNRAQAHLKLGNNRRALEDGMAAVQHDPTATKVLQAHSCTCSPALLSVLHSNRAQAHLKLGNNRKAREDGMAAVHHDCTATKVLHMQLCAHSNRAQAHLKLGNNRKALEDGMVAVQHDRTATKVPHACSFVCSTMCGKQTNLWLHVLTCFVASGEVLVHLAA